MTNRSRASQSTSKSSKDQSATQTKTRSRRTNAGPIAFFLALFVIAVGSIQIISAFHTYAINLSELNSLKKQEASLTAQKKDLENDIARWNDTAYVTAQARERLGYVVPGEQAIKVEHPEAVTGQKAQTDTQSNANSKQSNSLPWYSELAYSFKEADDQKQTAQSGSATNNDAQSQTTTTDGAQSSTQQ